MRCQAQLCLLSQMKLWMTVNLMTYCKRRKLRVGVIFAFFAIWPSYFSSCTTIKALKTIQSATNYDIITEKFANLLDVHSLACKIKVLTGRVLGT